MHVRTNMHSNLHVICMFTQTCIYLPSNMHVNEVVTCFDAEAVRVMLDSDEGVALVGLQNLF